MIILYLDASASVKRYYAEQGTDRVQSLFNTNRLFACADLGIIEVIATLVRKQKTGSYDQALLDQKIETLTKDWQKFIQIQQTAEVVDLAVLLAKQLALRGADAIHLASAHVLQTRLHSQNDVLHFICSDRELLQTATTSGLTSIDPTMQSE